MHFPFLNYFCCGNCTWFLIWGFTVNVFDSYPVHNSLKGLNYNLTIFLPSKGIMPMTLPFRIQKSLTWYGYHFPSKIMTFLIIIHFNDIPKSLKYSHTNLFHHKLQLSLFPPWQLLPYPWILHHSIQRSTHYHKTCMCSNYPEIKQRHGFMLSLFQLVTANICWCEYNILFFILFFYCSVKCGLVYNFYCRDNSKFPWQPGSPKSPENKRFVV